MYRWMLSLMLELCQEGMASGSVRRRQMITATESRFCFLPLFPSVEAAVIVLCTPNVTRLKFRASRNVNSRTSLLDEETGASGFTLWRLLNTSSCLLVAESKTPLFMTPQICQETATRENGSSFMSCFLTWEVSDQMVSIIDHTK